MPMARKRKRRKRDSMTKGERAVRKVLDQIQLEYEYDRTYPGLKNELGNSMRFDFVVKYRKKYYAIEYDGEQHYYPVPFDGNEDAAKARFERTKIADKMKDEFCSESGIPLLRIPYFKLKQTEQLVRDFLGDYDMPVYMKDPDRSSNIHMFFKKRY